MQQCVQDRIQDSKRAGVTNLEQIQDNRFHQNCGSHPKVHGKGWAKWEDNIKAKMEARKVGNMILVCLIKSRI